MPEREPSAPIVDVVGVGDDGPGGLGALARERIAAATLLCGGSRQLALFPEHPAERFEVRAVAPLVERLRREPPAARPVVLASGDPCHYGIGPHLATALGAERVRIEPHVGSVALAFARLGLAWHDAVVLTAHGRPLAPLVPRALAAAKCAFLTDEVNTPAGIAAALLAAGRPDAEAHVFEHLGGAAERHTRARLSTLAGREFSPLNLLVVIGERARSVDGAPTATAQAFGRPEAAYAHRDGQITKAEVRAVSLSKLRLWPGAVLWDIGAGCGSVGLEAARALHGRVYAIERDAEQFALLQANAAAEPAALLALIHGEAPAALADLPAPDAVFLGGSGGQLDALLACIAERLAPGGRLVANFATLEHLVAAHAWLRARGWDCEIVQLAVARGADLAGLTRLAAFPPVFVLSAERQNDPGQPDG